MTTAAVYGLESEEQQAVLLLLQQQQQQLLLRVRRCCLWGSSVMLQLAATAAALSSKLDNWVAATSLTRQTLISCLSYELKTAVEKEEDINYDIQIKGNAHKP